MKIENSFTGPLANCVESYIVRWWAFFASSRMNHRQHPGVIRSAVVAYAGFLCYVVNKLQNQIPKPYKIAFISFTIRVRISCSIALQSKSRRWISESAVDAE